MAADSADELARAADAYESRFFSASLDLSDARKRLAAALAAAEVAAADAASVLGDKEALMAQLTSLKEEHAGMVAQLQVEHAGVVSDLKEEYTGVVSDRDQLLEQTNTLQVCNSHVVCQG